ncbi:DNA-processing protein DprA [Patescibacteria group bacterium]|nr:DNA-processing protein DprA [Patescibacteria group bacterium]
MVRAGKPSDGDQLKITSEHGFWLAFSCLRGIGPKRFSLLVSYFGSARKAWRANQGDWLNLRLGQKIISEWLSFRRTFSPRDFIKRLVEKNYWPLFLDGSGYPSLLKEIETAPFVLYSWGQFQTKDERAIAVVGTRKMSNYGGRWPNLWRPIWF